MSSPHKDQNISLNDLGEHGPSTAIPELFNFQENQPVKSRVKFSEGYSDDVTDNGKRKRDNKDDPFQQLVVNHVNGEDLYSPIHPIQEENPPTLEQTRYQQPMQIIRRIRIEGNYSVEFPNCPAPEWTKKTTPINVNTNRPQTRSQKATVVDPENSPPSSDSTTQSLRASDREVLQDITSITNQNINKQFRNSDTSGSATPDSNSSPLTLPVQLTRSNTSRDGSQLTSDQDNTTTSQPTSINISDSKEEHDPQIKKKVRFNDQHPDVADNSTISNKDTNEQFENDGQYPQSQTSSSAFPGDPTEGSKNHTDIWDFPPRQSSSREVNEARQILNEYKIYQKKIVNCQKWVVSKLHHATEALVDRCESIENDGEGGEAEETATAIKMIESIDKFKVDTSIFRTLRDHLNKLDRSYQNNTTTYLSLTES